MPKLIKILSETIRAPSSAFACRLSICLGFITEGLLRYGFASLDIATCGTTRAIKMKDQRQSAFEAFINQSRFSSHTIVLSTAARNEE